MLGRTAAGYGWFVAPTPGRDEEFTAGGSERLALDPRAVARIDLLSVISHELGHEVGLDDLAPGTDDVMTDPLGPGLRRTPEAAAGDAILQELSHR